LYIRGRSGVLAKGQRKSYLYSTPTNKVYLAPTVLSSKPLMITSGMLRTPRVFLSLK